jgi:hypothetical protein
LKRLALVTSALIALIVIAGCGSNEEVSTRTVTVQSTSEPAKTVQGGAETGQQSKRKSVKHTAKPKPNLSSKAATISDGHWERGVDYESGMYRAPGGESCEWAQAESPEKIESGSGNTNYGVNLLVEITDKFFRTEECGTWVMQASGSKSHSPNGGGNESDAPSSSATISDGHWKAGTDYAPGLYRAPGGEFCEWAQGDSPGAVESGSGHTNYGVNLLAEIEDPYFRTEECGTWKKAEGGPEGNKVPTATTIPDGHWRSGADFQPGTYRAPGGEFCEWAQGSTANGVESGNGQTHYGKNVLAEITDEFFRTEGCGTWKKEG